MSDLLKRRLLWWILFGGGGSLILPIWFGGMLFLVIIVVLMVIGGLGYHAQQTPPPLPTQAVYSSQWLNLVQHVDAANGFFAAYPAVIWVAAMQSASGGMPLDRTTAGGYGLYDLPHSAQMGHPLAATNAFALDLRQHTVPQNLQATLNAVGATLAPPQSNWAAAVRNQLDQLEQGPEVAAWPITMDWSQQITNAASAGRFGVTSANSTVVWDYPAHTPIWVVATASAPVGSPYSVAWTPPYTACTSPPPHSSQKPTCRLVTDNLTGQDIESPTSMTLTTSGGQVVPMFPMEGPSQAAGFVYNHAVLYVTAQKVLVNATHPATITAHWGSVTSVSTPLPGQGFNTGTPLPVSAGSNPADIAQMITRWGPDIVSASRATGVPAAWIAGEMYEESKGNPTNGSPSAAYGLMQLEPTTARFLPGWYPGARSNPKVNVLLGAEYLAENHQQFPSWRVTSAAYEGGPGSVIGAFKPKGIPNTTRWTQAVAVALAVYPIGTVNKDNALMSQYAEVVAQYAMDAHDDNPSWPYP